MLIACAIAVLSVLLGAAVGFSRRIGDRHMGPVRTFAFAAALAVVFGQFLPDALEGMGAWAALPFAIGVVAPWLLERITSRVSRSSRALGLEIGYLGLLVHQLGDGVGMGTYTGPLHEGHRHVDVFLAIGGHTVPVAAMVVVAFLRAKGARVAAVRALGLALAVVVGVAAARFSSVSLVDHHHAAISALVGGLLLHIATHDLQANLPATARDRALDLLAGALGLFVVLATSSGHEHEHGLVPLVGALARPEGLARLGDLALQTAPALFVGLVASAIVRALSQTAFGTEPGGSAGRWLRGGSLMRQSIRGLFVGVPIAGSGSGTLRVAESLRLRGAAPALVAAFLTAIPALGIDTFLLSGRLLGFRAAALRLVTALVAAFVASVVFGLVRGNEAAAPSPIAPSDESLEDPVPSAARAAQALDELARRTLPWTVVGLLAAVYASVALDRGALVGLSSTGLDVLLVLVVAAPSYVCATSAIPLAAVLLSRGLSPGAVLLGLVIGPAMNLATFGWLAKTYGRRGAISAVLVLVVIVLGAAATTNLSGWVLEPMAPLELERNGAGAFIALALLVVLAVGASYRRGVRGFFAPVLLPVDPVGIDPAGQDDLHERCDHESDPFHVHEAHAPTSVRLSANGP